jgi:ubiquinone/menaquinone biosynthesis C-methylase UbiE
MRNAPGYVPPDALDRIGALTLRLKARGREKLALELGSVVLDVGSGTGSDACTMAEATGPQGHVTGLDIDPGMQSIAAAAAIEKGVHRRVRFVTGDARRMPFPDAHFDACWSERLFQHLDEPRLALNEMARVTKPGGRIAVADADWYSLSIHHPNIERERDFVSELSFVPTQPGAGRQLPALFREQDLKELTMEVFSIAWIDWHSFRETSLSLFLMDEKRQEKYKEFLSSLEQLDTDHQFFAHANVVLVAGVKDTETHEY